MNQRQPVTVGKVHDRIDTLKETSRLKRNAAAFYLGGAALTGYVAALGMNMDFKPTSLVAMVASVIGVACGTGVALEASSASQEAAALQGAVTLHELQVNPSAVETSPNQ